MIGFKRAAGALALSILSSLLPSLYAPCRRLNLDAREDAESPYLHFCFAQFCFIQRFQPLVSLSLTLIAESPFTLHHVRLGDGSMQHTHMKRWKRKEKKGGKGGSRGLTLAHDL